jgi:hypothetical protein
MRLMPIPYMDPADREKLRPKAGDTVVFEGVQYVVDQVGLKYVDMSLLSNPRVKGFAKLTQVSKWFPPEVENDEQLKNLVDRGAQ